MNALPTLSVAFQHGLGARSSDPQSNESMTTMYQAEHSPTIPSFYIPKGAKFIKPAHSSRQLWRMGFLWWIRALLAVLCVNGSAQAWCNANWTNNFGGTIYVPANATVGQVLATATAGFNGLNLQIFCSGAFSVIIYIPQNGAPANLGGTISLTTPATWTSRKTNTYCTGGIGAGPAGTRNADGSFRFAMYNYNAGSMCQTYFEISPSSVSVAATPVQYGAMGTIIGPLLGARITEASGAVMDVPLSINIAAGPTCTMNVTTTSVSLPRVSPSLLATNGSVAGTTPFSIALQSCTKPGSNYAANATWSFTPHGASTDQIKNTASSGAAANVATQILTSGGTPVANGSKYALGTVTTAGQNITANFTARYIATGAATAGAVQGVATYTLTYP